MHKTTHKKAWTRCARPSPMARENRNSYIAPEHLLYALIDQTAG
jgi:hypothetical protein